MATKKTATLEDAIDWLAHIYARAACDRFVNHKLEQDVYEDTYVEKRDVFTEKAKTDKSFAANIFETYRAYLELTPKERALYDQRHINMVSYHDIKANIAQYLTRE